MQINELYSKLKKEICDSLESIRSVVYEPDQIEMKKINFQNMIQDAVATVANASSEIANKNRLKIIDEFVKEFKTDMMRVPNKQELLSNVLSNELQIDESYIDNYIMTSPLMVVSNDEEQSQMIADIENDLRSNTIIDKL